jgi:hypothetical protein
VEKAVGDDVEDLAGMGAEDASEVLGLLAGEDSVAGGGGDDVGNEAAAHRQLQVVSCRLLVEVLFGDVDGDGLLVVEANGDGGGFALVPVCLGDAVVEEHEAFGGLVGLDGGLAEEGWAGEGFELGEGDHKLGDVGFLGGAGGGLYVVRVGEGAGEVADEDGDVEVVLDADGGEDVEVVFCLFVAADDLAGRAEDIQALELRVDRQYRAMGDADVGDTVGGEPGEQADGSADDGERDEAGDEEIGALGLGEGEFGHRRKLPVVSCQLSVEERIGSGDFALDEVLVHEDGEEGGGGDGYEGTDDSGEFSPGEQSDQDGKAHEVDALAHDARGKDGVLDVDVDQVEDQHAGHFGPGVEGGNGRGDGDGDHTAGDRNDVHQAHQHAEQDEVADVQDAEGDGAAGAEDKHQRSLAEEPFAHADVGFGEGGAEAAAVFRREEREEPGVGVVAFEHEVDAEDEGGEQVEDAAHPERERREEIAGRGGERAFDLLGDGGDAELVGDGDALKLGFDGWDAGWEVGGEVVDVADDGRKGDDEEGYEGDGDEREQEDDGDGLRDVASAPKFEVHDALDDGEQDDGKEGADVDEFEDLDEAPGQGEREGDAEGEEDVAAHGAARLLGFKGEGREVEGQGGSPQNRLHR